MEIVSQPAGPAHFEAEVEAFAEYLNSLSFDEAIVEYGWGCAVPEDERWKPRHVKASQLGTFLRENAAAGFCRLGTDDVFVKDPQGGATLKLCHEGDIHFFTENREIALNVIRCWLSEGIGGYVQAQDGHSWLSLNEFLAIEGR